LKEILSLYDKLPTDLTFNLLKLLLAISFYI